MTKRYWNLKGFFIPKVPKCRAGPQGTVTRDWRINWNGTVYSESDLQASEWDRNSGASIFLHDGGTRPICDATALLRKVVDVSEWLGREVSRSRLSWLWQCYSNLLWPENYMTVYGILYFTFPFFLEGRGIYNIPANRIWIEIAYIFTR